MNNPAHPDDSDIDEEYTFRRLQGNLPFAVTFETNMDYSMNGVHHGKGWLVAGPFFYDPLTMKEFDGAFAGLVRKWQRRDLDVKRRDVTLAEFKEKYGKLQRRIQR